ncbi:MAG: hypothetical protein WBO23_11070 [Burkholderiales bacterium]
MRNPLNALALAFLIQSLAVGGSLAAAPLAAVATNLGGVTVKATPGALSGAIWEFQIVFDTHSQELRDDVAKSASLVAGGEVSAPLEWRGDPPGGHHRKGVLRFTAPAARPAAIELRLARPGETEPRVFRWRIE